MTRPVTALLVLALLATVAGGAQCVVRCASPVAPPPCHHHSQAGTRCAGLLCRDAAGRGKSGHGNAGGDISRVGPTEMTAALVVVVEHPIETATVLRHTVLRI